MLCLNALLESNKSIAENSEGHLKKHTPSARGIALHCLQIKLLVNNMKQGSLNPTYLDYSFSYPVHWFRPFSALAF
jgi:hypothetical protein